MSNLSKKELELEHCLSVLACVITHHGTSFWPLYLLVEEELKSIQHRRDKLANSLRLGITNFLLSVKVTSYTSADTGLRPCTGL